MSKSNGCAYDTVPLDSDLPEGWVCTRIEELYSAIGGGTPSTKNTDYWDGSIPWISSADIHGLKDIRPYRFITKKAIDDSTTNLVPPGTVIVVTRVGLGKVALTDKPLCFSQDSQGLLPRDERLDPEYALYFLSDALKSLKYEGRGTTIIGVTKNQIYDLQIQFPSLAEQRRIVVKIEALLARQKTVAEHLDRAKNLLKAFRQSVLAAAISGRLTESWREKQLSCIDNTVAETDDFEIFPGVELPSIPESWKWLLLPMLGELSRGKSRHRPRNAPHLFGGDYPFIQTGDIAQSGGKITKHFQTYSEEGLAQSRLWPANTVCITIAANIADSAILTYPACFPDSVVGFISNLGRCIPQFVEYFIRTIRNDLSQYAPATAQKNINIAILNQVAVPLPSLPEQKEIVYRVNQCMELADSIEKRVRASEEQIDRLSRSVLNMAFRGELVPTEVELTRTPKRAASSPPLVMTDEIPQSEVDTLFYPRTDADRAVRSIACAVLEQAPGLASMDHLDAVLLATHPKICRIFLNSEERHAFDKACKAAPQVLFLADDVSVNWQECRDHLEEGGYIRVDHFAAGQPLVRTAASTAAFAPAIAFVREIARFALLALKQIYNARHPSARVSQEKRDAVALLQRLAEAV